MVKKATVAGKLYINYFAASEQRIKWNFIPLRGAENLTLALSLADKLWWFFLQRINPQGKFVSQIVVHFINHVKSADYGD